MKSQNLRVFHDIEKKKEKEKKEDKFLQIPLQYLNFESENVEIQHFDIC